MKMTRSVSPAAHPHCQLCVFLVAALIWMAPAGWCPAQDTPPPRPPNIILVLIDDLGWPDPAAYGHRFHETPHVDALCAQGMKFTDAYAAAPVCSPTRASIVSGQYPARVGVTDFISGHWRPYEKLRVPINRTQHLPPEVPTFAERLKQAGYATAYFGKWHLGNGPQYAPTAQGFDEAFVRTGHWVDQGGRRKYLAEELTDRGLAFMDRHRDEPFLLFLSHYAVHIPLQAEADLIAKYERKPKPETGINHPVYAAMVEHVDRSLGRVLARISELGLGEQTMVVFFSDNGGLRQMYTGAGPVVSTNAPLREEKGTLYEGGIRVPLIVRWPGRAKPGTVCSAPVSSVDLYPTFLDAAGLKPDPGHPLDGLSLVPLLRQTGDLPRRAIYWHYPHYHHSSPAGAVRQGPWKLVEFYEDGRLELYNLADDIGESVDLADREKDRANRLRRKLAMWRQAVGAAMPVPNPEHDPARAAEWGRHPSRK